MIYTCRTPDCGGTVQRAGLLHEAPLCARCSARNRKRLSRSRKAAREALQIDEMTVSLTHRRTLSPPGAAAPIASKPVVWWVETTRDVVQVFTDPRFEQMGYVGHRKRTPIPRISPSDPLNA